jgi:hypothetical protein
VTARPRRVGGFAAVELAVGVALLLVPALLLATTLPEWFERRHAAVVAARDAALVAAEAWPADGRAEAEAAGTFVARAHGLPASDVTVEVIAPAGRGDTATARATVEMPIVSVLGWFRLGGFAWTVQEQRRVDDHRSR